MSWKNFILVAFLIFAVGAAASPVTIFSSPPTRVREIIPRGTPIAGQGCAFPGNSDLYGLGIRLGVYLQLFSTLLANAVLSEEYREDARNTNAIIMIAIFAGMVLATINNLLNSTEIFVMSTLLNAFLWSDFTPTHISSYAVPWGEDKGIDYTYGWKKQSKSKEKNEEECSFKEEERGQMIEMKGYEQLSQEVHLGLPWRVQPVVLVLLPPYIAEEWNRRSGLRPLVFLQTQVQLGTDKVMLYIIVAVMNAMVEGVFAAWWLFILTPATIRFVLDIIKITSLSWLRIRRYAPGTRKERLLEWYVGFGRLDASKLKKFERFRLNRKHTEWARKLRLYMANATVVVTWMGLPAGYTVIAYTALAVELTLAWNNVTNIYVLGSTGQLIPFVVGILGLLQNMYLITKQLSERAHRRREMKSQRKNITVNWDTGTYVYGLGKDKELKLEAVRPVRRRSIDSGIMSLGEKWREESVRSFGQMSPMSPMSLRSYTWKS